MFVEKTTQNSTSEKETPKADPTNLRNAAQEAEYEMIMEVLKKANFNKSKAAKMLNIDRKTLYNKMKKYDMMKNEYERRGKS